METWRVEDNLQKAKRRRWRSSFVPSLCGGFPWWVTWVPREAIGGAAVAAANRRWGFQNTVGLVSLGVGRSRRRRRRGFRRGRSITTTTTTTTTSIRSVFGWWRHDDDASAGDVTKDEEDEEEEKKRRESRPRRRPKTRLARRRWRSSGFFFYFCHFFFWSSWWHRFGTIASSRTGHSLSGDWFLARQQQQRGQEMSSSIATEKRKYK